MSQVFPPNRLGALPADPEKINENYQEIIGTIQGNLGEQNFSGDSIHEAHLAENWVGEVHVTSSECARAFTPYSPLTRNEHWSILRHDETSGWETISPDQTWHTVLSIKPTLKGGTAWITASWQQDYAAHERRDPFFPGVQYALFVNGAMIAESVIGGLDRANDRRGEANAVWKAAFVTDAIIPVTNGQHTIELRGRTVEPVDGRTFDGGVESYKIGNRELIVMELR